MNSMSTSRRSAIGTSTLVSSGRRADVTVGNVLQLLLSAARLHTAAQHAKRQLGANTSTVHRLTISKPPNPEETAETWSKLLENPAVRNPNQTLGVLQVILEDGLLDSILPYLVSSLDLTSNPISSNAKALPVLCSSNSTTTSSEKSSLSKGATPLVNSQNKGGNSSKLIEPENKSSGTLKNDSNTKEGSSTSSEVQKILQSAIRSRPTTPTTKIDTGETKKSSRTPDTKSSSQSTPVKFEESSELDDDQLNETTPATTASDRSPNIVIHVCDEAHGLRQDFSCSRDLLIKHIGYFADLTEGQRLEDVDISVHCDISVFEWLLRWVKAGTTTDHLQPELEPKSAVSLLISADFLKMAPLVQEVLLYIHSHAQEVITSQANLNCLPDSLLNRLARHFNHWEVEALQDPKDRLQGRLYARLLQTLCDASPSQTRGIFRTSATLYKCQDCGILVTRLVERLVECIPQNTHVTPLGSVHYTHTSERLLRSREGLPSASSQPRRRVFSALRPLQGVLNHFLRFKSDMSWSLTDHVKELKNRLKTWRLTYWRLWGQVHFLPCSTCAVVFPASDLRCCRKHKLEPSFGDGELSGFGKTDSYPCCGARALRFSPLPIRNGCQMVEHTVQIARRPEEEWASLHSIYDDLLTYQVLICPNNPPTVLQHQGSYWRNVPLMPNWEDRSFLDRSCFITKGLSTLGGHSEKESPRPSVGVTQTTPMVTTTTAPTSNSASKLQNSSADDKNTQPNHKLATPNTKPSDSVQKSSTLPISEEAFCSSDEDEGGGGRSAISGGTTKTIAPKMKATLQRRVARAKRTVAYQVVAAPSWRWDASRSVRHNQDLQRDRESRIMRDLTAWLSLARSPDSATVKTPHNESTTRSAHTSTKCDPKKKEPPPFSPGIFYKLEVDFKQRHSGGHHASSHGAFRAKVQAISRLKMRLRNRSAFSAKP